MGGSTASPLRRRLALGGRIPLSPLGNDNDNDNEHNNLRDPLFPDDSPPPTSAAKRKSIFFGGYSTAAAAAAPDASAVDSPGVGSSRSCLAGGVPDDLSTEAIFTPVVKEFAGGRSKVKYFTLRAGLGAAPSSLYNPGASSSASERQHAARDLFSATAPSLPESSSYRHDAREDDARASIRRGARLHASLVETGVLPALPGSCDVSCTGTPRRHRHRRRVLTRTSSKARSLIPGHRVLRPGAAPSDNAGAASSPLRHPRPSSSSRVSRVSMSTTSTSTATPTRNDGDAVLTKNAKDDAKKHPWDDAKRAVARAAPRRALEGDQRRTDAAVVIQFRWRRMKCIEKLRNTLRLVCLLVRHDRMERAAAGEVVEGISEETLAEARAQAAGKGGRAGERGDTGRGGLGRNNLRGGGNRGRMFVRALHLGRNASLGLSHVSVVNVFCIRVGR